jgi:hypothetical protein
VSENTETAEEAAERLELALERIARAASRPVADSTATDSAPVAARLDKLIAQLRGALHS